MSNTSTVTPYQATTSSSPSVLGECLVAAGQGVVQLAAWLSEESPQEQALRDQSHVHARESLMRALKTERAAASPAKLTPASLPLLIRDSQSLLRTAHHMGFHTVHKARLDGTAGTHDFTLLQSSTGERLILERAVDGRLALHASGTPRLAQRLVRRHGLEQTERHFRKRGMEVLTQTLHNGELELRAQEPPKVGHPAEAARVQAIFRADGTVDLDVEGVRGKRCEDIVNGIAESVGGRVTANRKKDAYFRPGEATVTHVHG